MENNSLTKLMKRFNQLYFMKKEFDKKSDWCTDEMQKLLPIIQELMVDKELSKISFNNGITSSLETMTWAKVNDHQKAIKLLREAGLAHLILGERVNHQSLSAHLREMERNNEPFPKEWKGVIESNPTTKIVPRKP